MTSRWPGSPGQFARYYWSGVNAPVLGPDGRVTLIAIMAEDVTDRLHKFLSAVGSDGMYEEGSDGMYEEGSDGLNEDSW